MTKRTKTVITTVLLIMAITQGPFFYYFTAGFIKAIFLIPFSLLGLFLTIYLFVKLVRKKNTNTSYHIIGLTIAFFIGLFTVSNDLMELLDFNLRFNQRMKIVNEVENHTFRPISIAESNSLIEKNDINDILINKNENGLVSIEFYIDRGFLDHYSAFLYTTDPAEIKGLDGAIIKGDHHIFKKYATNWYRVGY